MRYLLFTLLGTLLFSCSPSNTEESYYGPTGTHEIHLINSNRIAFFNLEMNSSDTGNYRFTNDSIIVNQKYMGRAFGDTLFLNGIRYMPEEPESSNTLAKSDLVGKSFYIKNTQNSVIDTLYFNDEKVFYSINDSSSTAGDPWFLLERGKRQYLVIQSSGLKRFMLVNEYDDQALRLSYYQQNQRNTIEITLHR